MEQSLYGIQRTIEKQENTHKQQTFYINLRCIWWLNQKLVLQHVHPLNAVKTQLFSGATQFGAETVKNLAA
jgi:hypothetical protein